MDRVEVLKVYGILSLKGFIEVILFIFLSLIFEVSFFIFR